MDEFENAMLHQVLSVPELLEEVYPDVEPQVRYVMTTPEIYSVKKVVLTGCGDGYAACLTAKRTFEKFLQIPIEVVEPLSLSRYYQMKWVGESPCDPLVIAFSNSGRVTRVVEAVKRMRLHKAMTIAVTSNPDSPLAKTAEKVIIPSIPKFENAPGIRSYAVLQMVVYLLAVRMGEVRLKYTMEQANMYRRELKCLPKEFLNNADRICALALEAAKQFKEAGSAEMIGCGADYGTAWYAHEKMYEAVGLPAVYSDSENWFHVNYFARDIKQILTMVFASKEDEAHSRTCELIERLNQMGRDFILITDDESLQAKYRFLMPASDTCLFQPVAAYMVPALIAGYLTVLREETYSRGFEGIWKEEKGMYSTTVSETVLMD
ncbi:SIS domain-containing protein [Mediterraneibacter sp. NSJ-55]|uniref:SIS domain-containing protein n=1 Tax=Mediterraneibacter hominis TaxID=2763054 RepID=A0A923LH48_9FIRM|nr:SIS domain-containing protein [Mediterraneibacter hominis]MBC5687966.1 SIS domain-containing protein [Mediterraneibacter hominis]